MSNIKELYEIKSLLSNLNTSEDLNEYIEVLIEIEKEYQE